MGRFVGLAAAILALSVAAMAGRVAAPSWHGLTGLYVIPTARTLDHGKFAVGYNESKHVEFIGSKRFSDRQVRAIVNYGVTDSIEISAQYVRDLLDIGDNYIPQMGHQSFNTYGIKWRVFEETRRRPAIAIAARDITNDMQDIAPLKNVQNGTKFFLLASKRLIDDEPTGRFLDVHVGVTSDDLATSGLFGVELAVTPSINWIAEGMWDAPYLNFRGIYDAPGIRGTGDVSGRFIFDTGLRMYPNLVPGMVIDLGVVGDGAFEFSFGVSYVTGM